LSLEANASGRAPLHKHGRDEDQGREEGKTGLILNAREGGIAEDPPFLFDSAILYLPQPALPPHPLVTVSVLSHLAHLVSTASTAAATVPMAHSGSVAHTPTLLVEGFLLFIR
jgi:hypothetical protein